MLGRQLSRLPVSMAQTGDIPVSEKQIMMVRAVLGSTVLLIVWRQRSRPWWRGLCWAVQWRIAAAALPPRRTLLPAAGLHSRLFNPRAYCLPLSPPQYVGDLYRNMSAVHLLGR